MKTIGKLLLVAWVGSAGAACGSDSTGTSLANIVGTWHATTAVVTSVANPSTSANLIALGATLQIVFSANLTYNSTINLPGNAPEVSTGTYVETATQLTLHDASSSGDIVTFSLAQSGGTLLLTGGTPFTFNFGSGDVPAKFDLTLVH